MNTILVPTDFSNCASNAANIALEIAKKMDAELHFLHFTEIPIDWVNLNTDGKMYGDVDKRIKACQDDLNEWVKVSDRAGVKATPFLAYNQGYQNILEHLENHDIDLIVMGTHGSSGLKGMILGSNTQRVMRISDVPVMAIKETIKKLDTSRMTLAFDYPIDKEGTPESFCLNGLYKEVNLAKALDLKVDFLFVNTPGGFVSSKNMEQHMDAYAKKLGITVDQQVILNAMTLVEGIKDYQERHGDTILCMLTHGDRGFNRLINISHIELVANETDGILVSTKMDI